MRGYAKTALVSILMMGLLAVPNLSPAKDGDGKHHLLNADLRAKIEHLRDRVENDRERYHHNNQGGIPGSLQALQTEVANLKTVLAGMVNNEASLLSQLNASNTLLSSLTARLSTLETNGGVSGTNPALTELAKYVTVDQNVMNGVKGPHVIFHHANVHILSGSGTTTEASGLTGLGNLIVGYNEMPVQSSGSRVGSHNLVVGPSHAFTSRGGVVFGRGNLISGEYATTLGGVQNSSEGAASSILGGYGVVVSDVEATSPY